MHIYIAKIGGRRFLNCGDHVVVPIDRIQKFDFTIPNGGADESVQIVTDDADEEIIFANENAVAIRTFIEGHRLL